MTIYAYKCTLCGRIVNEHKASKDRDILPNFCPVCGVDNTDLERVIAAPPHVGKKGKGNW